MVKGSTVTNRKCDATRYGMADETKRTC